MAALALRASLPSFSLDACHPVSGHASFAVARVELRFPPGLRLSITYLTFFSANRALHADPLLTHSGPTKPVKRKGSKYCAKSRSNPTLYRVRTKYGA